MGSGGGNDGVMERMSGNTVTTVMAFAVSAMFVLFVFTRLFCARLRLGGAAAPFGASGDGFSTTVERGIHGLEPSVVASFPTLKFGDGLRRQPAQEGSQCSVCLEEYEDKDLVRVLPYCGHAFHVACIDVWLKQHSTCPICRVPLRASPRTKRAMPSTVHTGSTTAPFFLQSSASSSEPVSPLQTAAAASDRAEANAAAHEIGHEPVVSSNDSSSASAAAV